MDFLSAGLAIAGLLAAGVIKGATGIGYSSCALPFLVATIGLRAAIAVLIVPTIASNIMVVFRLGHVKPTVREFWPLYLASVPGIVIGIAILGSIDQQAATKTLAGAIILYGIYGLLKPGFRLPPNLARRAQVPVGLTSGMLAGLTGSQVLPLVPYMLSLDLESNRFTQAVNLSVILTSLSLGFGLILSNLMSPTVMAYSLLAVIPALAGVQIGNWARGHIETGQFKKLVTVVLMLIGLSLLVR